MDKISDLDPKLCDHAGIEAAYCNLQRSLPTWRASKVGFPRKDLLEKMVIWNTGALLPYVSQSAVCVWDNE